MVRFVGMAADERCLLGGCRHCFLFFFITPKKMQQKMHGTGTVVKNKVAKTALFL